MLLSRVDVNAQGSIVRLIVDLLRTAIETLSGAWVPPCSPQAKCAETRQARCVYEFCNFAHYGRSALCLMTTHAVVFHEFIHPCHQMLSDCEPTLRFRHIPMARDLWDAQPTSTRFLEVPECWPNLPPMPQTGARCRATCWTLLGCDLRLWVQYQ